MSVAVVCGSSCPSSLMVMVVTLPGERQIPADVAPDQGTSQSSPLKAQSNCDLTGCGGALVTLEQPGCRIFMGRLLGKKRGA